MYMYKEPKNCCNCDDRGICKYYLYNDAAGADYFPKYCETGYAYTDGRKSNPFIDYDDE